MLIVTEGIVIKTIDYSDTSIIVKVFTKEFGLVSLMVKGAKSKSKSSKAAILRPMNQVDLTLYYREQKNLLSLKEINLIFAPDAQFFGLHKCAICMFIIEVLSHTITEEKEKDIEKYQYLIDTYQNLKNLPISNTFYLNFFCDFLPYLGLEFPPSLRPNIFNTFNTIEKSTKEERISFFLELEKYYLEHISTFKKIKSIDILEQVFQN